MPREHTVGGGPGHDFPSPVAARQVSVEKGASLAFLAVAAALFVTSAGWTIRASLSMSDMGDMPMTGGPMRMAMSWWVPMCGQTWARAAASFVGPWSVMMVAMMLPALMPMLWRYREVIRGSSRLRLEWLTVVVSAGYFAIWTALGLAVFAVGSALATLAAAHQQPGSAAPILTGTTLLLAGAVQFTAWKAHHLASCRDVLGRDRSLPANAATAWRHGLCLGLHCTYCCANLTAILLAIGIMDLPMMFVVTAAITAERLAPAGERIARATGWVAAAGGALVLARAV